MHEDAVNVLRSIGSARKPAVSFTIDVATLPHATLTYSNAGEDVALRKWFKRRILAQEKGTYVDIGCAAPLSTSNTYAFYCLGWRGLCVDPNPVAPPHWQHSRPEDIFVSAAIAEEEGEATLYLHRDNAGMHAISNKPPSSDFDPTPHPVPTKRLDTLLEQHLAGKTIQIMSIDVEGAEMGVLRSNNWAKWRPETILIECQGLDLAAPQASAPVAYLLERGYRFEAKISGNALLTAQ